MGIKINRKKFSNTFNRNNALPQVHHKHLILRLGEDLKRMGRQKIYDRMIVCIRSQLPGLILFCFVLTEVATTIIHT